MNIACIQGHKLICSTFTRYWHVQIFAVWYKITRVMAALYVLKQNEKMNVVKPIKAKNDVTVINTKWMIS